MFIKTGDNLPITAIYKSAEDIDEEDVKKAMKKVIKNVKGLEQNKNIQKK